jgi:site-specific recombinase XerD
MKNSNSNLFFSMTYEFLDIYMTKQVGRSPDTIESYRDALTLFRRYVLNELNISIAKFKFSQCTRDCIFGFLKYLEIQGNKPGTRNQRLAAIKSYLWFAADKDVTLQSIALEISHVPQIKNPQTEKQILSEIALNAILKQPANTRMGLRDRTIMILLYDSAVRLSEILNIRIDDICLNEKNPYIRVMGKGSKERVIAINVKTVKHVNQYLKFYRSKDNPDTNLLFYTIIKGRSGKMSQGNVERFMKQYANKARETCPEVPPRVYPHMLRRTRATDLYRSGVEIALVSRILGHAFLDTTRVYAKPSLEMMRQAMDSVQVSQTRNEKPIWIGSEEEMAKLCSLR